MTLFISDPGDLLEGLAMTYHHDEALGGHVGAPPPWPEDEGQQTRRALRQIIERLDVIIDLLVVAGPLDKEEERT